ADPTRLAQVFVNLLNNAAKYTPPGGNISLLAAREGDTIVARVKDTGIGIPPDVLPRVFDTFTRVDHAADPSRAGLGIGLSLARHLVELHGGQIEACSDGPGHGSEFLVRLPVCVGAAGTQASREPAHGWETAEHRALRILVVDDNVDAAESISQLLRVAGHETHVAHDGLQAIEASARLDPDIVILDIGLPSVDGYEVARAIRGRGNGGHPRLIALTGWGQDEDKRLAAEAGFDRHLTKPVDPVLLRKIVEQGDVAAGDGAPAGNVRATLGPFRPCYTGHDAPPAPVLASGHALKSTPWSIFSTASPDAGNRCGQPGVLPTNGVRCRDLRHGRRADAYRDPARASLEGAVRRFPAPACRARGRTFPRLRCRSRLPRLRRRQAARGRRPQLPEESRHRAAGRQAGRRAGRRDDPRARRTEGRPVPAAAGGARRRGVRVDRRVHRSAARRRRALGHR